MVHFVVLDSGVVCNSIFSENILAAASYYFGHALVINHHLNVRRGTCGVFHIRLSRCYLAVLHLPPSDVQESFPPAWTDDNKFSRTVDVTP